MLERGRERERRSALRGVRALLKYHPPCPRKFLARRTADTQGHVLESADDFYTGGIRQRPRHRQRRVELTGKQPERDVLYLYDSRGSLAASKRRKLVNPVRRPARRIAP